MPYLVTGGTGYIGSYVVRDMLAAGKKDIVCMQRSGFTPLFREEVGEANLSKIKLVQGDVSNAVQLFNVIKENKIDTVLHFGYLMPPTSEAQPGAAIMTNCGGMNNVLEAARLFKLKKVIWSSSGKAFGDIGKLFDKPVGDDNSIFQPNSMYGACKVVNEYMTKLYFQKWGVDVTGIRLRQTFGTGRLRGGVAEFADFLRKAATDQPAKLGAADFVVALMYVEDASDLIVKLCDMPTTKTRMFNAIEGQFTNRQLVEFTKKAYPAAQVSATEGVKVDPPTWTSNDGLIKELKWKPKYGVAGGIKKALNYYRTQAGMPSLP